ncbi:MAG TPA: SAM-dependent methyltransferase [Puia sp.]|jgi:SAM-dependent MidA family methyltransferase
MDIGHILENHIGQYGPISFRDFMEAALYYPEHGYYTSNPEIFGSEGDFYTAPLISSVFGEMIATQIGEMWIRLDKKPFTIVEFGAGNGMLSRDILSALQRNDLLYRDLRYCIIEKSPVLRQQQQMILNNQVYWYDDMEQLGDFSGCVFTNEVLDNFSVYQVVMQEQLMELAVDFKDDFEEILRPADQFLAEYFKDLEIVLNRGFRTEVNLQTNGWIFEIARHLERGFVLTIDYGFSSEDLYLSPQRSTGTLRCYYKHVMNANPYVHIGKQDITAHVNFTSLKNWGEKYGLHFSGYTNQSYFLRALGLAEHLKNRKNEINKDSRDDEKIEAIYKLVHEMGCRMKVMVQQKGVRDTKLKGFMFPLAL